MIITNETTFKNIITKKHTLLNINRINRKSSGERPSHLRFQTGCGVDNLNDFLLLFEGMDVTPNENYTGSPTYKGQGFDVNYNGISVGVLLAVAQRGSIERKKYTPSALNLNGYTATDSSMFLHKIIDGLVQVESNIEYRNDLISILTNIEGKSTISNSEFINSNITRILSDFGEVASAYKYSLEGNVIRFPDKSNNNIADFYVNDHPYSVKGRGTGGKVNLSMYKDLIDDTSVEGKLLKSLASYDKELLFKYAAECCPEVARIAEWVSGTTENDIRNFTKNVDYDEFYNFISANFDGYGVPQKSKDERPRALWVDNDTNPFYFTLNTIIHRFWGMNNTAKITEIVSKFLTSTTFVKVDIINSNFILAELPFENVKEWQTIYWGRATKAWHNWMGVEPVRR